MAIGAAGGGRQGARGGVARRGSPSRGPGDGRAGIVVVVGGCQRGEACSHVEYVDLLSRGDGAQGRCPCRHNMWSLSQSQGFGSSEAGEGPEVSLAHLAAPDGHRRTRGEGQQLGTPASTRSGAVRGTPKSGKSSGGRADGAHERLTSPRARRTPRGGRGRGKAGGAPETDGGDTTRHTSPLQGRA